MSQILQQVTRQLKLSEVLRQTKVEQCFGTISRGNNRFCATGVLAVYLGWNPDSGNYNDAYSTVQQHLEKENKGIHVHDIVRRNDGRRGFEHEFSFTEIADWLEERGL